MTNRNNPPDGNFSVDSLGGISFLDPNLILGDGQALTLKEAKKTTVANTLSDLLDSISQGDVEQVRTNLAMLKEPPGSGWLKKLMLGLLNADNFNEQVADEMESAGILPFYMLDAVVRETDCYEAYAWMLATPERIKKCIDSIGTKSHNENKKNVRWMVEQLVRSKRTDIAAKLDLSTILKNNGDSVQSFNVSQMTNPVLFSFKEMKNPVGFIDKLYSAEVLSKASKHVDLDSIRADSINSIISTLSYSDDFEKIAAVEKLIRKSPNFSLAWNNYWNGKGDLLANTFDRRVISSPYRSHLEAMNLQYPPARDIIDYLIGSTSNLVIEALGKQGTFPDKIYEKLSQGNGHLVHLLINRVRSEKLLPTITHMMGRMGVDWTDDCGRGWGHCLAIFAENTNTKIIQAFIRDPNASKLLTKSDKFGKSALDYLSSHKEFEEKQEFIVRTKRNMLLRVAGNTSSTAKKPKRPSM